MQPTHSPSEYKLFVLRLWRDMPDDPWRIAIQPSGEAQLQGLPSIEALSAFICAEMKLPPSSHPPLTGQTTA